MLQTKISTITKALVYKTRIKQLIFPLFFPLCVAVAPGQFLLEQSRLAEAAEMAERAAELESSEFDVVFNAAHMLRSVG